MSTAKKFAGQTAIYGLTTIISRMIGFVMTPFYARVLPATANGVFTVVYSYAAIINAVLAFGMETTFFRYLQKREDDKQIVYNNTFGAVIAMSVVFLTFATLFFDELVRAMTAGVESDIVNYKFYFKCLLVILIADAICVIPFAKLRADGRPMKYSVIKCLNIGIVVLCNVFFLFVIPRIIAHQWIGADWFKDWYTPMWVGYAFLSNAIASVFTVLLLLPEILKITIRFDNKLFKEMFLYSWPVLIANISFIINETLDKAMLKQLLPPGISDQQAGVYGMCAKIALFLSIFVQAFRLGAEPFFFSQAKNKNAGDTYSRIMTYFVIMISVICVGLVANIDILATIIVDKEMIRNKAGVMVANPYWAGLGVVPPLLFGYLSLGIYMNLSVWYKLSDQTKYGLYISGIGAVLTVVLNYIFIPEYSYMASAYVSLLAYSTMMILSYIWGQKNYPIPYNVKTNLAYIVTSIILVILSFYVFDRNIFVGNALLILFAGGTLWLEGKQLKAIFLKR
ncbi:oligosaccharide flippase family protein [Mucilaginibacter myungsuensis]|uniref:Oligosaccharide flippase family protein n=1 Tax=Mucilaginibacter myungsuensis TaxID=649104 RepID=A0A929PWX0_9SPHI|nr:oligosaccharide flippase family protein [Mucilaginibacter myungsuensis]MBE9663273.1 oligosaccharide flippase family protein [Mucilaginibacter myungsuensis]MDN3600008.1 oligosaccharide flippase family protein [Mucilaginibacter myungsuensis]